MRLKYHTMFFIVLLIFGLSFPIAAPAKEKKIPPGVPFKLLLKKINALTERVEALENQLDGGLKKYLIEADYHHLGDYPNNTWIIPEPEGTYWDKSFTIEESSFKNKSIAFVMFVGHHIDWSDLIVNGEHISIVSVSEVSAYSNYLIPLPAAFFHSGENTIGFEVFQWDTGNYDDMEFGELEIWFQ